MAASSNLLQKLMGGASAPLAQMQREYQAQVAYQQQMANYTWGTATTNNTVYAVDTKQWKYALDYVTPNRVKGAYRRTVKAGEVRYSESPLKWLDERIDEMRVVL